MHPHSRTNNLNKEINKADGAIQHTDQINKSHSTVKSTTQGVAHHNLFIETIHPKQTS